MSENPLPPSNTDHQDAADRPPVHKETKVQALAALRADIEAAYVKGMIETDQKTQALQAVETILGVLDALT